MANSEHVDDTSISDLVKNAIEDVQELVKIDIALAKQEMLYDIAKLKRAAIAFGVAAVGVTLALAMLIVALFITIGGGVGAAVAFAAILLGLSIIIGTIGYRLIPNAPGPDRMKDEVVMQAKQLKERIA